MRLTRLGVALTKKEVMKRRLSVVRRKTSNDIKNDLYKNIRLLGCHRVMIPSTRHQGNKALRMIQRGITALWVSINGFK